MEKNLVFLEKVFRFRFFRFLKGLLGLYKFFYVLVYKEDGTQILDKKKPKTSENWSFFRFLKT